MSDLQYSSTMAGGFTGDPAAALQVTGTGGCCGNPAAATLAPPESFTDSLSEPFGASPCCGSAAEAAADESCCGSAAKADAVSAEQGCCG